MNTPREPKIALVHDHLDQFGGGEAVLRVFHDIWPSAPIYTLVCDKERVKKILPDAKIYPSFIQKLPFGLRRFKWYLPLMPAAFEKFDLSEYDIVLSDSSAFSKGVITSPKTIHIDYCHTPTRYLWTDHYTYVRDLPYNKYFKGIIQLFTSYLRLVDRASVDRVDHFIANSSFVQRRIQKYYKRDSVVIYPPVQTSGLLPVSEKEVGDYFLIVSRLRPYKKVDLAVQAFNHMGIPLKIIGGGEDVTRLRAMANKNIEFLGEVDNATRNYHLQRCRAFVHPQEEDFGISAVEAMSAGRPVIAFGSGGALESVVDGKTGLLFFEQTWESLSDKVVRSYYMHFDPQVIHQHALQFSEERFKEKIKELVREKWEKRV